MMVAMRIACLMAGVLLGALVTPIAASDETEFEARWKQAEESRHSKAGHEFYDKFFKEFYDKFYLHINECTQQTGEKIAGDGLKAAVELASSGHVLTVLVQPQSRSAECFAKLVKQDAFSKPPAEHFWVPVDIRFTQP